MSNESEKVAQEVGQHSSTAGVSVEPARRWHPLLGNRRDVADTGIVYETALNARRPSYLEDHCIYGSVVVPAAAYAEMAVAAGTDACPRQDVILQGMAIQQAMLLESGVTRVVRTILTREEKDLFSFRICSGADCDQDPSTWLEHASGKLIAQEKGVAPDRVAQVGNAAGTGARLALISRARRRQARDLALRVRYLELARAPRFARNFAAALTL